MRTVTLPVEVYVLEASDVEDITQAAFTEGRSDVFKEALAEKFPHASTIGVGIRSDPRLGHVPWVRVDGLKVEVGDGVVFHPALGTSVVPEILLLDAVEELPPPRPVSLPADAPAKKAVAKKAAKKK